jgi:hypothetical protein
MATDVVEAAKLRVLATHHEDALADHVDREEVARLGRMIGAPGIDPLAEEDLLALELEELRRVVVAPGESRPAGARHAPNVTTAALYRRSNLDTWCAVGLHCAIIATLGDPHAPT